MNCREYSQFYHYFLFVFCPVCTCSF